MTQSQPWQSVKSALALTLFTLLTAGFALTVVIHEAGHWLGAHLAGGFELESFAVFPLTWRKQGPRWVCTRSWKRWWAESGRVQVFTASMHDLRRRALLFMAGGPLASLVSCIALAAVMAAVVATGFAQTPPGRLILLVAGLHCAMHMVTAVLTLAPIRKMPGASLPTDGWNILSILRADPLIMARWASMPVIKTVAAGRPLASALDREQLAAWSRREDPHGYLHLLLVLEALSRDAVDEARALVKAALAGTPPRWTSTLDRTTDMRVYATAFAALIDDDQPAAAAERQRVSEATVPGVPLRLALLDAVLASGAGDTEAAASLLAAFDAMVAKTPSPALEAEAYVWIHRMVTRRVTEHPRRALHAVPTRLL